MKHGAAEAYDVFDVQAVFASESRVAIDDSENG
jgi:hypothetical protein